MSDAGEGGDPTRRNRLDDEQSPYLRQHADNPVNWQPWDETARGAARERDVPIFLSIGYSACHWCHVMEEESFADEEIATLLNENFVPVKVDREERPDVDSLYMTVCQIVTGSGGWPLSAFLTPEGEPFYVGTYFPKEASRGQPGFRQLLEDVADSWESERADIEERAAQWAQAARGQLEDVPDQPGEPADDVLERTAEAALRSADREHGGFGTGQKFPQPRRIDALLAAHEHTGRTAFSEVALEALDAMVSGGLYDHVGGGFHRYCTDREWAVPHFEKMLYDNAEIPRALLSGYQVTGDERYRRAVEATLSFVERELTHPAGGFFSTLDARSADPTTGESEEGAFYVWTPEEIRAAVGDDERAALFCERYGVTDAGNFEGATVLTEAAGVEDLAEERDRTAGAVRADLDRARDTIMAAREERPRPARDEKVLAGWNGLMVSTFAEAALALDGAYATAAREALAFVREHHWDGDAGRLHRRFRDGEVGIPGYLEDYAFLARAGLDLYGATGEVTHLAFARELGAVIESEFYDDERGTLYFTPRSGESLVARPQELADQSTPSSAGVAADALLALDQFVPHDRFGAVAERVVETHAERLEENPLQHPTLARVADTLARGHLEFTIVADAVPEEWLERIGERHLPERLLAPRPADGDEFEEWLDALGLAEAPPVWAGRGGDGPAVYVCRRACSPPLQDIEEALEWAAENA
jgi:uncharacterized protein YyaL (SSP411 family)